MMVSDIFLFTACTLKIGRGSIYEVKLDALFVLGHISITRRFETLPGTSRFILSLVTNV